MSVKRISSRYAKSVLDFATEQSQVEDVVSDMKTFLAMAENRDLQLLLKSPIINASSKKRVFDALFGRSLSKTTNTFFNIVLRKGRENLLPEIANEFILQYKLKNKISEVKLTTAYELSEAELSRINQALSDSNNTLDKIDLQTAVNPDLIGGFVIEIDDKLYDASVAHKLDLVKKEFSDNEYVAQL